MFRNRKNNNVIWKFVGFILIFTALWFFFSKDLNINNNKKLNIPLQNSEIKKVRILGGNVPVEFKVEVADDPKERSQGLMYRNSMSDESGMLFIFDKSDYVSFWMKNTLIPLDMIFIDQNHKIAHIVVDVKPCPEGVLDCPLYPSELPVKYVLELNAGLAKKNGLKNGDFVEFE